MLNRLAAGVRRMGLETIDLGPKTVMERARKEAGLSRFLDYDFEAPLARLLDSYENDAELSLLGRVAVRTSSLLSLTTQLQIQRELELHPEILETPIEKPIFILGLPRTGTTLLHNLLAQGRNARSPMLWELERPAPAIGPDTPESDPRIGLTDAALSQTYKIVPHLQAVHAFDARMPEECVVLLRKIFCCGSFAIDAHLPSYLEWFFGTDLVATYREFRKMLQLLMWRFPGHHLVLKSPLHLFAVDAILEVFPDARIIQTHRDPRTVAASGCSLSEVLRMLYTVKPDPRVIGQDWLQTWGTAMSRTVAAREKADAGRFFDVHFSEVVAEPIRVTREIHQYFGMDWDDGMEARCLSWIARNPSEKHGKHDYDLDYYGIAGGVMDERFAAYLKRFAA
jgi:hypothetical protein